MARRTLDRRELREQSDAAERAEVDAADEVEEEGDEEGDDDAPKKKKKAARPKAAKAKAPAKPRKPRAPKAPPRLRARWAVYDGGMKQVAVFDYNQRADADARLAVLLETKKGIHFVRMFKEPMPVVEAPALA